MSIISANGNLIKKLNTKTANFDLKAEYNAANLPIKYQTGDFGKEYDYSILYRVNGQKIYESDSVNDTSKTYDYNSLGQLETEINYKDKNNFAEFNYTYDASGNRIRMRSFNNTLKKWDTVTDYTYNANNQLTESVTKVNNDLTETKRYYYDDNGNTLAEQKKTYTTDGNISSDMAISGRSESGSVKLYGYDYFNRLIQYNDGKTTAEYTYGADNLRTSKTVNGTKTDFVWNGQNLAGETKNGTETVYTYDQTGIIASKKGADTAESFFKDPHGDIIAISKGSNIIGTYDYTAFGNKWIGEPDPFGYCGEYLDSESGLIYLRNRYYSSETGRFVTADPYWNIDNMIYGDSDSSIPDISAIMQSSNLFVYCVNNPINLWDPSGEEYNTVSQFIKDYSATRVSDNYEGRYTVISLNGHTEWVYWDPNMNNKTYGIDSRNDYGQLEMEREDFLKIFKVTSEKMALDYSIENDEAIGRTLIINGVSIVGTRYFPPLAGFDVIGGLGGYVASGQYRQEQYYAKFGGWVYITRVTIDPSNNITVSPGRQSVREGAMSVSTWKEQLSSWGYR